MSAPNFSTVLSCMLLSLGLSFIISIIYEKTNKGFSYESSFTYTLMFVCVIVTTIMITIGSNIALSLGLIGSLSIIRFRTVIKSTVDMAYLFWCIAVGLAVGAYNYYTAIGCVVFLGAFALLLNKSKYFKKSNTDYVLVVQMSPQKDDIPQRGAISSILNERNVKWELRSCFADNNTKEITYSIYSKRFHDLEELIDLIGGLSFVKKVSFLSPETNLFI